MRSNILSHNGISGIMEWFLRIAFFLGIAITLSLPWTLRPALYWFRIPLPTETDYWLTFAFMVIFGASMVLFVLHAARIFRTINQGQPFVAENVRALLAMAQLSLVLCADCWFYSLFGHSILSVLLGLVFLFLCGLFLVLRELFKSAIHFKEENDFTI